MLRRLRFHIIAILSICIVIMVLYGMLFQLKPANPEAPQLRYKVFVIGATWGENCNDYISKMIEGGIKREPEVDENGNQRPPKPYELVKRDNILDEISRRCNGQVLCQFPATQKYIVNNPHPNCNKKLDLTYRCYDLDRIRVINTNEGREVKLDCSTKDDKPPPAPPPPG